MIAQFDASSTYLNFLFLSTKSFFFLKKISLHILYESNINIALRFPLQKLKQACESKLIWAVLVEKGRVSIELSAKIKESQVGGKFLSEVHH